MSEALDTSGLKTMSPPKREIPSLSLILSLPNYDRKTGHWHGRIRLHGRIATVDITMFDSKFPVWGEIAVDEVPGKERWRFEEKAQGVSYQLISANLPTMLIPHATAPGGAFHGVGIYLALKKILKDAKKSIIPVEEISLKRSRVQGPGGIRFLKSVVDELSELASALKTSIVNPAI